MARACGEGALETGEMGALETGALETGARASRRRVREHARRRVPREVKKRTLSIFFFSSARAGTS